MPSRASRALRMAPIFLVSSFLVLAAASQPAVSPAVQQYLQVDAPKMLLQNVRIVDGTGSAAVDGQSILIQDGRIRAVGPADEVRADDAEIIELEGYTVIPGLVGLHNHTFYTTSLRSIQLSHSAPILYLASGVTTVRTTGSHSPYAELNLSAAIDRGDVPGPRMIAAGPYITGGSGVSGMSRVYDEEDARRMAAYWAQEGVGWLKAYTDIGGDELMYLIDEAHKHGVKVTAHLCSVTFREAVERGIDNLEHGLFANSDFHPNKTPGECPPDHFERLAEVDIDGHEVQQTIDMMIDAGVGMTSTQAVYEMYVPGRPPLEDRVLKAMSNEVRQEYLRTREATSDPANERVFRLSADLFKKAQQFELRFARSGGLLGAGVDPTGFGGALPGYGDQRNFQLLIETGFTPEEAIQIMTLNGARILGLEGEIGSIEVGKSADLVVISGNPAEEPEDIRNVALVFKQGLGYDPEKLIDSVEGMVGIR